MRCLHGPNSRQQWMRACGTHAHRTRSQRAAEPGRQRQGFGGKKYSAARLTISVTDVKTTRYFDATRQRIFDRSFKP